MKDKIKNNKYGNVIAGVILIFIGFVFVLKNYFGFVFPAMKYVWPFVLIVIGVFLLFNKDRKK